MFGKRSKIVRRVVKSKEKREEEQEKGDPRERGRRVLRQRAASPSCAVVQAALSHEPETQREARLENRTSPVLPRSVNIGKTPSNGRGMPLWNIS